MWIGVGILVLALTLPNFSSAAEFLCGPFTESYKTCDCNKTTFTVTCRGSLQSNTSVFQNLPSGVRTVIITGNNFKRLPTNLFGNCTNQPSKQRPDLKKLDLSDNNITFIHGKTFHCIPNVEEFILRNNEWLLDNHNHVFSSMEKLKVLDLDNAFSDLVNCTDSNQTYCTESLTKLTVYINTTGMGALESLNLARNEIWTIPEETQVQFGSLRSLLKLNLSDNEIAFPRLNKTIQKLGELDLSNNRIPFLRDDFIRDLSKQPSLRKLYINDNLYECDCWMKDFTLWLQNETLSKIVNRPMDLLCFVGYGKIREGDKLISLDVNDLACPSDDNFTYRYSPTIVAMSVLCVVIVVLLLVVLFLNREKVKATWRRCAYSQSGLSSPQRNQQRYSSVKT